MDNEFMEKVAQGIEYGKNSLFNKNKNKQVDSSN